MFVVNMFDVLKYHRKLIYRMAGKFDGEFNLTV